jgi:hypothetical protein
MGNTLKTLKDVLSTQHIELSEEYSWHAEDRRCTSKGIKEKLFINFINPPSTALLSNNYLGNCEFFLLERLYWLPWIRNYKQYEQIYPHTTCGYNTAYVPWKDLEEARAKFFLTSLFTGCRFTISANGIQHVSHHENDGDQRRNIPTLKAETTMRASNVYEITNHPSSGVLKMSIGEASPSGPMDYIYDKNQNILVMGEKTGNVWSFYAQHRNSTKQILKTERLWGVYISQFGLGPSLCFPPFEPALDNYTNSLDIVCDK